MDQRDEVKKVVHYQVIMMKTLLHSDNWTTRCSKMLVTINTYLVGRAPATNQSLSLLETCQWILWRIVISTDWKGMSYNLTLVIIDLYNEPIHMSIDAPCLQSFLSLMIWYQRPKLSLHLSLVPFLSSTMVTTYASFAKISIFVQITFRVSYVWQISLGWTSEVTCIDLAISQKI